MKRILDLVIKHADHTIAVLNNYPTIPPIGHQFSFEQGGRFRRYDVIGTRSVVNLDNARSKVQVEDTSVESVRVEVEPS